MSVVLAEAAGLETLWVLQDRLRFAGPLPGTEVVVAEVTVPPGAGTPLHRHASPELFRVLSGRLDFLTFEAGEVRRHGAGPGDVLRVPADAPHGYANPGTAPAELLVVLDRRMEAFFRDIGTAAAATAPPTTDELARIAAACVRHGVVLLGGPAPG